MKKAFFSLMMVALLALTACSQSGGQANDSANTESFESLDQEPRQPTASPTSAPDTPLPTILTPEIVSESVLISTSPDARWKVEALLAHSYDPEGAFPGPMDYARLTVYRVDGSQKWTPYEQWFESGGVGGSFISKFYWSSEGHYLYFIHEGNSEPCGYPFTTNLRRVDLGDGSLSEIPLTGLRPGNISISPDAGRMAYPTEEGILVYDLASGSSRTIAYEWPEDISRVGGFAWSPDGKELAFTIEGFCDAPEASLPSFLGIISETGEVHTLTEQEFRLLLPDDSSNDSVSTAMFTLQYFLNYLNWGSSEGDFYQNAAVLYGGSYETLVEMNPEIAPKDHATLLRNACQANGFQCLHLREVLSTEAVVEENGAQEFRITVNLLNPDGSVFSLGPCCGEDPAGEPQTEFVFIVRQMEDGAFKVLNLPPYMP